MNIIKKLFNNKLNLTVITILLLLLFILYNIFLSNRPEYYNIEGYEPLADQITCTSDAYKSSLGDRCPGLDTINIRPGTCAGSYLPNTDEYRRCVDIPPPSSITPASGVQQEVGQKFCTSVKNQQIK